jgi:serine/threonine protein kinase
VTGQPPVIGRYEILRRLGAGGMGEVYLARDPSLLRTVAIKLLIYEERDDLRERFFLEARSAGNLNHPNIVTIHDLGEHEGRPYIVMEYIQGDTLAAIISRERAPVSEDGPTHVGLTLSRRLRLLDDLCSGLGAAHSVGIIHRDIKPANLVVDQRVERHPTLKILDFGIARIMDATAMRLTTGPLGTPRYMAPEQHLGKDCDHRADIFAAGAVFYELLTYRPAFRGETYEQVRKSVCEDEPTPLPDVCPELGSVGLQLAAIATRALQKDIGRRYASIEQMGEDIERVRAALASTPTPVPSRGDAVPVDQQRATVLVVPAPPATPGPAARTSEPDHPSAPVTGPPLPPEVQPTPFPGRWLVALRSRGVRFVVFLLLVAGTVAGVQGVRWWTREAEIRRTLDAGRAALTTHDWDTAARAFRDVLALREEPEARGGLNQALAAKQQAADRQAPADTSRPVEEARGLPAPAQREAAPAVDVARALDAANAAYGAGEYASAISGLAAALKADPNNRAARALMDQVVSARAAEVRRLVRAGEAAYNAGDFDAAIRSLNRALAIDGTSAGAAELLAKSRAAKAAEEQRRRPSPPPGGSTCAP